MDTKQGKSLNDEIERALIEMEQLPVGSEEYMKAAQAIDVLKHAKTHQESLSIKGVPVETIIAAATNILGILLVLNYEKFDVITSKAFGMVSRGRNI